MDGVVGGGFEEVQDAAGIAVLDIEPFGTGADRILSGSFQRGDDAARNY